MTYYSWEADRRPDRQRQLARILCLPVAAVEAWEEDAERWAAARAEWDDIQRRFVPKGNLVGRRALAMCRRRGLAPLDVWRANDHALIALDGMGPAYVAFLRVVLEAALLDEEA